MVYLVVCPISGSYHSQVCPVCVSFLCWTCLLLDIGFSQLRFMIYSVVFPFLSLGLGVIGLPFKVSLVYAFKFRTCLRVLHFKSDFLLTIKYQLNTTQIYDLFCCIPFFVYDFGYSSLHFKVSQCSRSYPICTSYIQNQTCLHSKSASTTQIYDLFVVPSYVYDLWGSSLLFKVSYNYTIKFRICIVCPTFKSDFGLLLNIGLCNLDL